MIKDRIITLLELEKEKQVFHRIQDIEELEELIFDTNTTLRKGMSEARRYER